MSVLLNEMADGATPRAQSTGEDAQVWEENHEGRALRQLSGHIGWGFG